MQKRLLYVFILLAALLTPQLSWAQCDDSDHDLDGCSCQGLDCDDSDPDVRGECHNISTGALMEAIPDTCDGKNNDCDDSTADGSAEAWFGQGCDGNDADLCAEGQWQCVAGQKVCSDPNDADPDICDGLDNDCNPATADGSAETWLGQACDGNDADLCAEGQWQCNGSKTCSDPNDADPDLCNGLDDDCNPATADGSDESNFGQACDGTDSDQCADGHFICNGSSMVCDDDAASATETCNGQDDDCDGATDEDWPTLGNGCDGNDADLCANGTFACNASHDGVTCVESQHYTDLCNGQDDDCNPATADGSAESWFNQACDGADSDLCLEGTATCVSGHQQCSDNTGDTPDICNGSDDDCNPATADGSADPQFGQACDGSDADQCLDGTMICDGSSMVCGDDAASATESCNGQDDDCDGQTDEDWPELGDSCDGTDSDLCSNGTIVCRSNHTGTRCRETVHVADLCNDNTNDDCNPATADGSDESWYGQPCDGADSDLCAEGVWQCVSGGQQCSDTSDDDVEICDGSDNDCDGDIDEGFDEDHDGVTTCAGDCDDHDPDNYPGNQEVCDNQDNNCNGDVDEGFDVDGDGYFDCAFCAWGSCDCDDSRNDVFPNAPEQCDEIDHDCDCELTNGFTDADGDGVPACAGTAECNDDPNNFGSSQHGAWYQLRNCTVGSATRTVRVLRAATERCDALDNDCDSNTDENLQRFCYDGPAGTIGIGTCIGGQQVCDASVAGTEHWGTCAGEIVPANDPALDETTCDGIDDDCDGTPDDGLLVDADSDGVRACGSCGASADDCDCDDANDAIYPGATELCDNIDQDCDGDSDDVTPRPCFEGTFVSAATYQGDCPGHAASCNPRGTCVAGTQTCEAGGTWSACGGALVLPANDPAAAETSCDQLDNDCDGQVDDGDFDLDGDGALSCAECAFLSPEVCDCNDARNDVKPGGTETCDGEDNDCNGQVDDDGAGGPLALACYSAQPAETEDVGLCHGGFHLCENGSFGAECVGEVIPDSDDPCDGFDNDCDGEIDEGHDQDQDGVTTCGGDCNDADPDIFAGNIEICDGKDNDCDGDIDGGETACYSADMATLNVGLCHAGSSECRSGVAVGECLGEVIPVAEICDGLDNDCDGEVDEDFDLDHDGHFDCAQCPLLSADECDCDDGDAYNYPGVSEICDCFDNNCNGQIDEGGACEGGACHDLDADGYRNCDGDCNDHNSNIGPGFAEIWGNGLDDDCDGAIDEDVDEDGDGFTIGQGDCDDRFVEINPDQPEVCDGFDNNCDGQVDEGFDLDGDHATTCAGDCDDNDNQRSPLFREVCGDGIDNNCNGIVDEDGDVDGDGVSVCQGDCNDHNVTVHGAVEGITEAAVEVCDGQDNDCDGRVDEDFDNDGDRWFSCLGDCDDDNPDVNPDKLEIADNGIDDDCDGQIDEGEVDMDGDGFSPNCGDCNDNDSSINPHAAEACDRIDNNCDGYVDAMLGQFDLCATCFDADNDGFTNCEGDCNDNEPSVYPGATEICDLLDNDCDHSVDLDPQGFSVCGDEDAGQAEADAAVDDASVSVVDAGLIVDQDAGTARPKPEGILVQGCQCTASGQGSRPWWLLGLLGLALWRRKKKIQIKTMTYFVFIFVLFSACSSEIRVPGVADSVPDAAQSADSGLVADAGPSADVQFAGDAAVPDQGAADSHTAAVCTTDDVIVQSVIDVPATRTPFAVPPQMLRSDLAGVDAVALDDEGSETLGFVLHRNMPDDVDEGDEHYASALMASEMALLDGFQSMAQPIERIEEHRRVFVDLWGRAGVESTQRLVFASPVTVYQTRDAVLNRLSHLIPGDISGQPAIPGSATVNTEIIVKVLFVLSRQGIVVVSALSTESEYARNQILMADLTNGSHLGVEGYSLRSDCEAKTMPELFADFLWVIDNSASMQEEQQALASAADSFYDALTSSGLDFRLGVTTTDSDTLQGGGFTVDPVAFSNNVQVGINGNGREMGLDFGLRTIENCRASQDPARMLRDEAALLVIFVSDEDSTNLKSVDDYVADYQAAGAVTYGIVGPLPWGCQRVGLGVARPGRSYIEVSERTGGATGSICNPNLAETITSILIGAAGAASRSPLQRLPVSNSLAVKVKRDGVDVSSARSRDTGFDFEPGSNNVLFFGDAQTLPPAGAQFQVAYQYFAPPEG